MSYCRLIPMLFIRFKKRLKIFKITLDFGEKKCYNSQCFRGVAQFGRVLRSGHGTIQFIKYPPNSHKPFNTAIYGDLKNKIHVVKSVLTTCYPTDTGI